MRRGRRCIVFTGGVSAGLLFCAMGANAQSSASVRIDWGPGGETAYLRLLLLFASVSLAPAVLAVLTSFARIVIVLFFLRAGLGSAQIIPNPVLIGLALLLTIFNLSGSLTPMYQQAVQPLIAGRISPAQAWQAIQPHVRSYFAARARPEDIQLFQLFETAPAPGPTPAASPPPLAMLAAAYALSELRAAFIIGFIIFLPFVVIDLIVAGTIASLGLSALPHTVIALPFKVLLFVLVDGWRLLAYALLDSLK